MHAYTYTLTLHETHAYRMHARTHAHSQYTNTRTSTQVSLFDSDPEHLSLAVTKILSAKVHPMQAYVALHTYSKGRGIRGRQVSIVCVSVCMCARATVVHVCAYA